MEKERLALIDPQGARAVVTWPLVRRSDTPVDGWLEQDGVWLDFDQWCAVSGLDARALLGQIPVLFGSGLVETDGSVDPTAVVYAKALAAKALAGHRLKKAMGRRPPAK